MGKTLYGRVLKTQMREKINSLSLMNKTAKGGFKVLPVFC